MSDNYNDISIDRFSSKSKIGKHSWYFGNSLFWKLDFRLAAKGLFPALNNQNNTFSSTTDWWEYSLVWKRMLRHFSKIPQHTRISESLEYNRSQETTAKMKISRQKLNQWFKICHMNYINGAKLHAKIIMELKGKKNALQPISMNLKTICKIKQFLSYILMIKNKIF